MKAAKAGNFEVVKLCVDHNAALELENYVVSTLVFI